MKEESIIEKSATPGLSEDCHIGNGEKTSKITLVARVSSLRGHLEERGLDTIFRIFDTVRNTEVYLLKEWGSAKPDQVATWKNLVLTRIGGTPICDYDVDKLKCSRKYIVNNIYLDLWELINKYLVIKSNGTATYTAIISKIQQFSLSMIRNIFDELGKMYLIKEPGQDVDIFRAQVI